MFGDPDDRGVPSARRRLALAGGDVAAAFQCRLDDLLALAWGCADRVLASWRGSRTALVVPVLVAAIVIVGREGLSGLVTNAENLGCIGTASFLAVKGLRAYRGITAPKRPQKKDASSAGQESAPNSGAH